MKKYRQVFINSFAQYFAYRLNFILWRVRIVISIIMSYFLWTAVFTSERQVFGYSQNRIITYILLTIFVNGIVLSTQTAQVATEINFGTLSKFLIRPLNFFAFNIALQGFTDLMKIEDKIEFVRRMHEQIMAKIKMEK